MSGDDKAKNLGPMNWRTGNYDHPLTRIGPDNAREYMPQDQQTQADYDRYLQEGLSWREAFHKALDNTVARTVPRRW